MPGLMFQMEMFGGMDVNLIFWYFLLLAVVVNALNAAVNYGNAPTFISKLALYGKTSVEQAASFVQVPKR